MAKATKRARNHRPEQAEIDAVKAKIEDGEDAAQLAAALAGKRAIEARRNEAAAQKHELREARGSIRSYASDGSPEARLGWARELLRYAAAARAIGRESLLRGWCELLKDHAQFGPKRGARLLLMAVNGESEQAIADYLGRSCELLGEGVPEGSDWRAGMDYIARNVQEQSPVAPEHCADAPYWIRGEDEREAPPPAMNTSESDVNPNVESELPILSKAAAAIYELLLELPEYRALTGGEIVSELNRRDPKLLIDESALRGRHAEELVPYGLENAPRKGYRIKPSARPAK